MQSFDQYLKNIHAMDYMGTDDDMPDDYERWLGTLEQDILMQYANDYLEVEGNQLKTNA